MEKIYEQEMITPLVKQLPVTTFGAHKTDVRTQFAALPYRVKNDKVEVLIITSRGTGRWIVPKGWPMDGKTPAQCAKIEAWEEAGVIGKAEDRCLGIFSYQKVLTDDDLPVMAMLYPVRVKSLSNDFPEAKERRRKWVTRKKAAKLVDEPELARIIKDFDPRSFA